jgi:hypothetical protein
MPHRNIRYLFLVVCIAGAATPCLAQQPAKNATQTEAPAAAAPAEAPAAPAAAAATSSAASSSDASTGPSPELLKKARLAGYKPETQHGATVYCSKEASLGTRFEKKTCYNESQIAQVIEQREQTRMDLKRANTCGGLACGAGH